MLSIAKWYLRPFGDMVSALHLLLIKQSQKSERELQMISKLENTVQFATSMFTPKGLMRNVLIVLCRQRMLSCA